MNDSDLTQTTGYAGSFIVAVNDSDLTQTPGYVGSFMVGVNDSGLTQTSGYAGSFMVGVNDSDLTQTSGYAGSFMVGVNCWSVLANVLIIIIISKTSLIKGAVGKLLINLAVADIGLEVFSILQFVHLPVKHMFMPTSALLGMSYITIGLHGVSVYTNMILGWNLYRAVSQQQTSNTSTRKVVCPAIIAAWVVNLSMPCLYFIAGDYFQWDPDKKRFFPTYTSRNWWICLVMNCNFIVIPVIVTGVFYHKVKTYSQYVSRTIARRVGEQRKRKLLLAQLNLVTMSLHIVSYIPLHVSQATRMSTAWLSIAFALVFYSYHILKLFLYLKIYRPFQDTLKDIICCRANRVLDIPATPLPSSTLHNHTNTSSAGNGKCQMQPVSHFTQNHLGGSKTDNGKFPPVSHITQNHLQTSSSSHVKCPAMTNITKNLGTGHGKYIAVTHM